MGYKNVAFELIDWANLIRDHWSSIQGKTALTEAEVQNAKDLGERLVRAAGLRDQAPLFQAEAARIRQQALTLMVGAYDATRRAIGYLRWEERDADTIAPSLYAGKTRKAADEPTPPVATPPGPTPPVPRRTLARTGRLRVSPPWPPGSPVHRPSPEPEPMSSVPCLNLGNCLPLDGGHARAAAAPGSSPGHARRDHGMTGSGKTGLLMVLVEEALRTGVAPLVRHARPPRRPRAPFQPRHALSWLRGPMTRTELRKARELALPATEERRSA